MSSLFGQPQNNSTQLGTGGGVFGSTTTTQNKPNLFGALSTNTSTSQPQQAGGIFGSTTTSQPTQTGGLFGSTSQPPGTGLFGSLPPTQAAPSGGLFGSTTQPAQGGGLFGSTATSQPAPSGGSLFDRITAPTSQPAQGAGLFGSTTQPQQHQTGGLFGSTQPAQQTSGLFGTAQPTQQTGGLFSSTQPAQQTGGLFGSSQPAKAGGLFGSSTTQQGTGGLFGNTQTQPQSTQQGTGLFGNLGNTTNQQPQQQQQQQHGSSIFGSLGQAAQQPQQVQQQGSVLSQPLGQSRLFQGSEIAPRQKSVIDQIELAFAKWNPESPHTLFQTYLYNAVPPETAPFYGPGPQDDETKWEEALAKKTSADSIPVAVRGFEQLGTRMQQQFLNLNILKGRLHEINDGLNSLLQKHDLDISIRAAECRRKHQRLSRQCLSVAAKTQVLRNRGYAMDDAEEELRKKLLTLEKSVFDPALNGRGEEVWARMVSVQERGRQLQKEYERAGSALGKEKGGIIDEDVMKRAKKILEDYNSQLSHLAKELEQIQKDWKDWESSKSLNLTNRR